jgi:hypothetical protein
VTQHSTAQHSTTALNLTTAKATNKCCRVNLPARTLQSIVSTTVAS